MKYEDSLNLPVILTVFEVKIGLVLLRFFCLMFLFKFPKDFPRVDAQGLSCLEISFLG